jgi:hypothetical protein
MPPGVLLRWLCLMRMFPRQGEIILISNLSNSSIGAFTTIMDQLVINPGAE